MTSQFILFLYAVQVLAYAGLSVYFALRVVHNHFHHHTMRPLVISLAAVFGSQAAIQLYRFWSRAIALTEGRATGLDSPWFAAAVVINAAAVVALFVTFRNATK